MNTGQFLREPLVHFLAVGAALFAIFLQLQGDGANEREIVVTAQVRDYLASRFERVWGRPATAREVEEAVAAWVREEILYREGMNMRLGEGDPVVRRRMAQKVMMLAEAAAPQVADEEVLAAWFDERREAYRLAQTYTLEQRYFASRDEGSDDRQRVAAAVESLNGGTDVVSIGEPTLLPAVLEDASSAYIASVFGETFAGSLASAPEGRWYGPLQSAFGLHAVRVSAREGGQLPSLDEVRAQVEQDWAAREKEQAREAFYAALRERYTVTGESP
jgi:hypothetical protein